MSELVQEYLENEITIYRSGDIDMGFMDNLTKMFNLDNDDDYDYDDYDDEDYDDEPERPSRLKKAASKDSDSDEKADKPKSNVINYKKNKSGNQDKGIRVVKPATYEDGREIADALLDKKVVVLNLEGLDYEIAQRVIDFASGACYSINGTLQKVSTYIFVVAPANVDVAGDIPEFLADSGIKFK